MTVVTTDVEQPSPDRLLNPAVLGAGFLALFGFLVAAGSTNLALVAGEPPMTLLPPGTGGGSLAAIVAVRAIVVVILAAAVLMRLPQHLVAFLAATGLFWIAVGAVQAWLMLART